MLTQKNLDQIEKIVDEKTKHLPTKDEFYEKMDEVVGEVRAMREEQTLIGQKLLDHSDQLESHEERISRLEKASSTI